MGNAEGAPEPIEVKDENAAFLRSLHKQRNTRLKQDVYPSVVHLILSVQTPAFFVLAQDNKVAQIDEASLSNLKLLHKQFPNVTEIKIKHVTDDAIRALHLSKFRRLTNLFLDGTIQKYPSVHSILNLPYIQELVWRNHIWTDPIINRLAKHTSLLSLTLLDNHLTDEQARKFLHNTGFTYISFENNNLVREETKAQIEEQTKRNRDILKRLERMAPIMGALQSKSKIKTSIYDVNPSIQAYLK